MPMGDGDPRPPGLGAAAEQHPGPAGGAEIDIVQLELTARGRCGNRQRG